MLYNMSWFGLYYRVSTPQDDQSFSIQYEVVPAVSYGTYPHLRKSKEGKNKLKMIYDFNKYAHYPANN